MTSFSKYVNDGSQNVKKIAKALLLFGVLLALWYLILGGFLNGNILNPDISKAKDIAPFITGLVVPCLTLGSALLVYENLRNTARQNFSGNFFKLIEMHHKLRDNIKEDIKSISKEKPFLMISLTGFVLIIIV